MQNEYIQLMDLRKTIGDKIILNDINASIKKGECVALIGKNAAGKSMLLKAIAAIISFDSGSITIAGSSIGFDKKRDTDIGFLIESPGFWPQFSGLKNLQMLASLKRKISLAEIKGHMEYLGLDPNNKLAYRKYSLGMKQKLGIIQAVMEKPDLILLDEPTSNLDEASAKKVRELIKNLNMSGATIIITSHNGKDFENICTRELVICDGKLEVS